MGTADRGRSARRRFMVLVLGGTVLVASACTGFEPSTPSSPSCTLLGADFGGCAPDRPNYDGTTCRDLAEEWGADVDKRIRALAAGPAAIDGNAKSVRNVNVLVLTSLIVTARMDELGLRESCSLSEFWPVAEAQFTKELPDAAVSVLWDGAPATFGDWKARARQIVAMIDEEVEATGDLRGGSLALPASS